MIFPMSKPLGGRGRRAPYDTVMVRVPEPIKPKVEALIEEYREFVLSDGESVFNQAVNPIDIIAALKLVYRFIEEIKQEDNLHQRNNRNLVKFRDWLNAKLLNTNPDS